MPAQTAASLNEQPKRLKAQSVRPRLAVIPFRLSKCHGKAVGSQHHCAATQRVSML